MNPQDTWVVLPGFNEEQHLVQVISAVKNHVPQILYVDDGSTDQSYSVARSLGVHALRHEKHVGKGAALRTGCDYVFHVLKAEKVILLDSDLQHHAADLPGFLRELEKAEIVFGARKFNRDMPLHKRIINRVLSACFFFVYGKFLADIPCGFKAFHRKAYAGIKWEADDYGVEMEIAARALKKRMKFKTIPITTIYHPRPRGMTFLDALRLIGNLLGAKRKP